MIPESFLEELKYRSDIEQIVSPYTNLKRAGRNLTGLCPFHSEKTPSFVVYPENNSFYCFGCGAGGDIITFVRMAEHLEYTEAVRFLADRAGMKLPEEADDPLSRLKTRVLEANREAARFYHETLISAEGRAGLDYLRGRGLSDRTIRRFGLGFAPDRWDALRNRLREKGFSDDELVAASLLRRGQRGGSFDQFRNRVIFPIIDLRGSVIAFGGRIMGEGRPKYLNSPDTPVFKKSRGLFALNLAKATAQPRLILCEGYMDAIAVHQAGFDNAVATLGTALTDEQARLISQYTGEVVIAYDSDEAGQKATRRAAGLFAKTGVRVRVLTMAGAKDPDEYLKKYGQQRFARLLDESANSTEYAIGRLRERFDLGTDDGKVAFLREFAPLMAGLQDRVEADVYTTRVASELGVSREALAEQIRALRERNARAQKKKFDRSLRLYTQELPNQPRDPQREENLRCALAEDRLIALILRNPEAGAQLAREIGPEDFVTDSNREIFTVLSRRLKAGQSVEPMLLSGELDAGQMGRISYLLASARDQSLTPGAARDYIAVLRDKRAQRTPEQVGSMDETELAAFVREIAEKKKKQQ